MSSPPIIDHIGWDLWRAAQGWKTEFDHHMAARGYPWFAEARGNVFRLIGRDGTDQAALGSALGASKQAVQQQVDGLQDAGLVQRTPDPNDSRKKRIVLTPAGRQALHVANEVKQQIAASYQEKLGAHGFQQLSEMLALLNGDAARRTPK